MDIFTAALAGQLAAGGDRRREASPSDSRGLRRNLLALAGGLALVACLVAVLSSWPADGAEQLVLAAVD